MHGAHGTRLSKTVTMACMGIAVEGIVDVSGTGHLTLGSMISAAIEAWEGGGPNLGRTLKPLGARCRFMHGIGAAVGGLLANSKEAF